MTFGAILALIGLVVAIIFWVLHTLTTEQALALFIIAFLAILLGAAGPIFPWPRWR